MNTPPIPPPSAKERAITIMAEIATIKAVLNTEIAPYQQQVTELNALIAVATAPHQARLDALKAEAEALGLAECAAVFGETHSSLVSGPLALKLSDSEAVGCDDEETTIKRLLKEAGMAHLIIAPEDADKTEGDRMAARACLRIKFELNKAYIQSLYDAFTEWFNARGIYLEPTRSVKLTEAPKPRVVKTKAEKAPKKGKKAVVETQPEEAGA